MINYSFVTFILLLLHFMSNSINETEPLCAVQLKVPRNTEFKARVMTELKINCTLTQHGCQRKPKISWCKMFGDTCEALNHLYYIKTEWKDITEQNGMAFLFFKYISIKDAGSYRCKHGDMSISHSITVTVTENEPQCVPKLKVPRNIEVHAMTEVKIGCIVTLHGCQRKTIISWCKTFGESCKALNHSDYIRTEWKNITASEMVAFLIFKSISMEDTGLYRCRVGDMSISHSVNVTVTANNKEDEFMCSHTPSIACIYTEKINENKNKNNSDIKKDNIWVVYLAQPRHWSFVYIYNGMIGLMFIVLALFLLYIFVFQGRKSSRKCMANKNQDKEMHRSDLILNLNSNLLTSVVQYTVAKKI